MGWQAKEQARVRDYWGSYCFCCHKPMGEKYVPPNWDGVSEYGVVCAECTAKQFPKIAK